MAATIAFGPVPSRRLGRSLGINNIPPKICSYSCVYCQLGRTREMRVEPRLFYGAEETEQAVCAQVERACLNGEAVDYLTFVANGEPTLDSTLGITIDLLRPLGIPVAVITNASLIWRGDVRKRLMAADWVSLKVDSVSEEAWRRVNRPHGSLTLTAILDGMLQFARDYRGELVTETMLVEGINDDARQLGDIARFLANLRPARAYLAIPTRAPAEEWVHAPTEQTLHRAYQVLKEKVAAVEYLIGYEGDAFSSTGDAVSDLLSITAVHPMREEAVRALLTRARADWTIVRRLVAQGQLLEIPFQGHRFYMRRLGSSQRVS